MPRVTTAPRDLSYASTCIIYTTDRTHAVPNVRSSGTSDRYVLQNKRQKARIPCMSSVSQPDINEQHSKSIPESVPVLVTAKGIVELGHGPSIYQFGVRSVTYGEIGCVPPYTYPLQFTLYSEAFHTKYRGLKNTLESPLL